MTIEQINAEVSRGGSVVGTVRREQPARPALKKADAVTSATMKNNVYLKPMPAMMPLPPPKKAQGS